MKSVPVARINQIFFFFLHVCCLFFFFFFFFLSTRAKALVVASVTCQDLSTTSGLVVH